MAAAAQPAHPSPPIAPSLDGAVVILEEGSRSPRPGTGGGLVVIATIIEY